MTQMMESNIRYDASKEWVQIDDGKAGKSNGIHCFSFQSVRLWYEGYAQ